MSEKNLGDFQIALKKFESIDLGPFETDDFKQLNAYDKHDQISQYLTQLIRESEKPAFLLAAVVDFIDQVCSKRIISRYNFQSYELWLNQFSGLTPDENLEIRAAIMGKRVPRDCYQAFFPIGMGKTFEGTHFVAAHASPDLDTTVASFWGWVDAFAARVGSGLHVWNVPGGTPSSGVEVDLLFHQMFGKGVFTHLAKTGLSLSLSSYDLMTQRGLMKKQLSEPTLGLDHERNQNAVILIDEKGYYIGDWRNMDVEGVRQVIMLLNACLSWFENNLHIRLISLFAKPDLKLDEMPAFIDEVTCRTLRKCDPALEFTLKQQKYLGDYLQRILGIEQGLDATFRELGEAFEKKGIASFDLFTAAIRECMSEVLFDSKGAVKEDRPRIFTHLEKIVTELEAAMVAIQKYMEKLQMAFQIKTDVFGFKPSYLSHRADIEEIKAKMGSYPNLTVNYLDDQGRHVPVGIISSTTLRQTTLGTVTLRDFSNRNETKIPPYLDVISVIDHHKTELITATPPMALITDAQSSNALVAELAFSINDHYSTGGMTSEAIENELKSLKANDAKALRIQRRLLQRKMATLTSEETYIDPSREALEYSQFLYAILDDTDLLTKVTEKDVHVVAQLINRLKSLMINKEVESVHFDDIPRNEVYVRACADRLLRNTDLHALYSKVYSQREVHVDREISLLAKGEPSILFEDTKIQNGCARVGQTKIFSKNYPTLSKHISSLQAAWIENAKAVYKEHMDIVLHIQMISTIASAQELYEGVAGNYDHQDELWIWIPETELAVAHLKSFLNAWRTLLQTKEITEIELLGDNSSDLAQIFRESFIDITPKVTNKNLPIAVIRYKAGTINSRKAMITPFLPSSK